MLCVNETPSRLDVARGTVTLSQVGSAWPVAVYPQYYPQEFLHSTHGSGNNQNFLCRVTCFQDTFAGWLL